jgi:hypothetical protein
MEAKSHSLRVVPERASAVQTGSRQSGVVASVSDEVLTGYHTPGEKRRKEHPSKLGLAPSPDPLEDRLMPKPFAQTTTVMLAAIFAALTIPPRAQAASPFPDKNLEAAIRSVLKHEPNVELTAEKLHNVYILEAPEKGIKDLTGLEKCKNLALLKLTKNQLTELKPLKDLVNLESLDLADNQIKDITPLANLKGLQYIELSNNKIENVAPLGGLTSLTSLYMGGNAIKDITPLAPLTRLWTLSMGKNQIKNIGVLEKLNKLSTIDLSDNQVEDLSPLSKQTELKLLMMERNAIKDLKPLVEAAKADAAGPKRFAPYLRLYIAGNPLAEATKGKQLEALKAAGIRIEG